MQQVVGGVRGDAELEDEQRDRDREDAVAERLEPAERQLVGGFRALAALRLAQTVAGRGFQTALTMMSRITETIDMMIAAQMAVQKNSSIVRLSVIASVI